MTKKLFSGAVAASVAAEQVRRINHSFGAGGSGIPATTSPPRASGRVLNVLGIDPGATTGWCLLRVSLAGSEWVIAGAVRDADAIEIAANVCELVAIETVTQVYSRERFGAGMATDLLHAAKVGERLAERARARGIPVAETTAASWRRFLTGLSSPTDAKIKTHLGFKMALPKRSNAHERDAAGVGWKCGLRALISERLAEQRRKA